MRRSLERERAEDKTLMTQLEEEAHSMKEKIREISSLETLVAEKSLEI